MIMMLLPKSRPKLFSQMYLFLNVLQKATIVYPRVHEQHLSIFWHRWWLLGKQN